MNINYFITIMCLSFCMMSCKSTSSTEIETVGKATLIFRATQEEITVDMYAPIDGAHNFGYITDKLDLKPNISINYEINVNDFAFIKCIFSSGGWGEYLIFPGDCLEITCEHREIIISGSNAEGHNYFHDNYINKINRYVFSVIPLERLITIPINYDSIYN